MTYQPYIKRVVYVAKCKCGAEPDVKENSAPRERLCPSCKEWIPYVEQSAIGPNLNLPGYRITIK